VTAGGRPGASAASMRSLARASSGHGPTHRRGDPVAASGALAALRSPSWVINRLPAAHRSTATALPPDTGGSSGVGTLSAADRRPCRDGWSIWRGARWRWLGTRSPVPRAFSTCFRRAFCATTYERSGRCGSESVRPLNSCQPGVTEQTSRGMAAAGTAGRDVRAIACESTLALAGLGVPRGFGAGTPGLARIVGSCPTVAASETGGGIKPGGEVSQGGLAAGALGSGGRPRRPAHGQQGVETAPTVAAGRPGSTRRP
jgi:hypothetical protein